MLAKGIWGADRSAVEVTSTGSHVTIDCTFGDMPAGISLDDDGRFTADGSYVLRAFPVLVGPPLPAQFSGQVITSV